MDRRFFLKSAALIGCSAAAMPFLTPVTFASVPGENRLVVIILRGAMDGLDVVQPYGDPYLRGLRQTLSVGPGQGASDLDGFYALHPGLEPLRELWTQGEMGFAHAVSTPYRDKRSHSDGQDLLEAGTAAQGPVRATQDGWLNRLLQVIPGATAETLNAREHDVRSRFFEVHVRLRLDDHTTEEQALVVRSGLNVGVRWRERVASP